MKVDFIMSFLIFFKALIICIFFPSFKFPLIDIEYQNSVEIHRTYSQFSFSSGDVH
jgi:hypothetical protein